MTVDGAECWINATTEYGSKTMELPIVSMIEDSYTATLQEYSTVMYGYGERFIMDMGVSERLTLKIERPNPPDYDDTQDDDQSKWSNGRWYRELEDMLNFWQNLGRDMDSHAWTGGLRLYFRPPAGYRELYPLIEKNVFLLGSINVNHGTTVQKLTLTLPFVVGRMTSEGSTIASVEVRFEPNPPSGYQMEGFTKSYPLGTAQVLPSSSMEWDNIAANHVFFYWSPNPTEQSGEARYFPGDLVDPGVTTWYGRWSAPFKTVVIRTYEDADEVVDSPIGGGSGSISVPEGASYAKIIAVGSGGGGGSGAGYGALIGDKYYSAGGGGGSGDVVTMTISVSSGDVFGYGLFAGGKGAENSALADGADGSPGKPTVVLLGGEAIITARGGDGGGKNTASKTGTIAKGGTAVRPGGDSASGFEDTDRASDGASFDANGIADNRGGKGAVSEHNTGSIGETNWQMGGGGGGAADIYTRLTLDSGVISVISMGGDGGANHAGEDGIYGGGGGGTSTRKAGDGGSGFLAVMFFSEE